MGGFDRDQRRQVGLAIGALEQAQANLRWALLAETPRRAHDGLTVAEEDVERAENHLEGIDAELLVQFSQRSWARRARGEIE